jgi:hypothetical protein
MFELADYEKVRKKERAISSLPSQGFPTSIPT